MVRKEPRMTVPKRPSSDSVDALKAAQGTVAPPKAGHAGTKHRLTRKVPGPKAKSKANQAPNKRPADNSKEDEEDSSESSSVVPTLEADSKDKEDKGKKKKDDTDSSEDSPDATDSNEGEESEDKGEDDESEGAKDEEGSEDSSGASSGDDSEGSKKPKVRPCTDCLRPLRIGQRRYRTKHVHYACGLAVRAALHALKGNPKHLKAFQKLKKEDPRAYARGIIKMAKDYDVPEDPSQKVVPCKQRRNALQIKELFGIIDQVSRVKKMTRDDGDVLFPKLMFIKHLLNTVYKMTPDKALQQWKDTKRNGYSEFQNGVRVCAIKKCTELNNSDGIEVKKKKRVRDANDMKDTFNSLARGLKASTLGTRSQGALCDMLGGGSGSRRSVSPAAANATSSEDDGSNGPCIEEVSSSDDDEAPPKKKRKKAKDADDTDDGERRRKRVKGDDDDDDDDEEEDQKPSKPRGTR